MPDDTQRYSNSMGGRSAPNGDELPGWQWLTVGEVARAIGLTEERVRQLIRERKIKATKLGGWLVKPMDLQAFIRSRTNMPES